VLTGFRKNQVETIREGLEGLGDGGLSGIYIQSCLCGMKIRVCRGGFYNRMSTSCVRCNTVKR
jgi:hypothetical protein